MNFKQAYREANAAFVEDLYEEALDHYNTAVLFKNDDSDVYAKRAQCHLKLRMYKEAVIDANTAIQIDGRNARGHLRRGIGLFHLRDYENAQKAFEAGLSVASSDRKTFETWINNSKAAQPKAPAPKQQAPAPTPAPAKPTPTPAPAKVVPTPAPAPAPAAAPAAPAVPKIRHEWFQNDSFVTVTIFAKGVNPAKANINIQEQNLGVSIKLSDDNSYELDLDLCGTVDSSQSSYDITPTKVEIKLKKLALKRWATLEAAEQVAPPAPITNAKNWDAIVKDEAVEEDKSEMGFLRDLYSGASEEEKRAIMKSMEQSGGTVLNMNWGDVEGKFVKPKPSEWSRTQYQGNDDSSDSDSDENWGRRAEERAREYHSKHKHKAKK